MKDLNLSFPHCTPDKLPESWDLEWRSTKQVSAFCSVEEGFALTSSTLDLYFIYSRADKITVVWEYSFGSIQDLGLQELLYKQ